MKNVSRVSVVQLLVLAGLLVVMCSLVSLGASPQSSTEVEIQREQDRANYILEAGKTVNDDLFAGGASIRVNGNVTGDVVAAGENIVSRGKIGGDTLLAARTVTVSGPVEGNIRVAAQNVIIDGSSGRNLMAFGQSITIAKSAKVGRNLISACQSIEVNGRIGGKVRAYGENVTIGGKVNGDVIVEADSLTISDGADIGGDVKYKGSQPPKVAPGARVGGKVSFEPFAEAPVVPPAKRFLGHLLALIKFVVFGILLAIFAAKGVRRVTGTMMRHSLRGIGAGLLSVILVPLLVIVLAILVIGQAVAWALAVGYVSLLLVVAVLFKAIFGIAIGEKLLALWQRRVATLEGAGVPPGSADEHDSGKREAGRQKGISLVFAAILGAIVIYLVSLLPIIGVIVNVGAVVLTLGTLVLLFVEGVMSWPGRAS